MKTRIVAAAILVAALTTGCTGRSTNTSQTRGQAITEDYMAAAEKVVPYPRTEMARGGWLERRNVSERLVRYSDPTKISYIYLLSRDGGVVSFYTVKGKVSSTNSQLTTDTIFTRPCSTCDLHPVTAPGDDASYGENEPGIFFFTTDNVMITWHGDYVLSDAPQKITTPPKIEYQVGSQPSNTSDSVTGGGQ